MIRSHNVQAHALASPSAVYYYCAARCVRDSRSRRLVQFAAKRRGHRKAWVVERLRELGDIFAIELCAYSVMPNHYHMVLRVDAAAAQQWSDEEVIERWQRLFGLPSAMERFLNGPASQDRATARAIVARWRGWLTDVTRYVRYLNDWLAERANLEERRKHRTWRGRFTCRPLTDAASVLTAMAYVDLNPVRAGLHFHGEAEAPTSIYDRKRMFFRHAPRGPRLRPFLYEAATDNALPCSRDEYFELVDWTRRAIRRNQLAQLERAPPESFTRLQLDARCWKQAMSSKTHVFRRPLGLRGRWRKRMEETSRAPLEFGAPQWAGA